MPRLGLLTAPHSPHCPGSTVHTYVPTSKLDYGFVVYWSARLSHLVSLDHMLNAAMRVSDGSISDVTNTESLCSESRDAVESQAQRGYFNLFAQADETVFAIHD